MNNKIKLNHNIQLKLLSIMNNRVIWLSRKENVKYVCFNNKIIVLLYNWC